MENRENLPGNKHKAGETTAQSNTSTVCDWQKRKVEKVFEKITAKKTNLMKILRLIQEAQQIPSGL